MDCRGYSWKSLVNSAKINCTDAFPTAPGGLIKHVAVLAFTLLRNTLAEATPKTPKPKTLHILSLYACPSSLNPVSPRHPQASIIPKVSSQKEHASGSEPPAHAGATSCAPRHQRGEQLREPAEGVAKLGFLKSGVPVVRTLETKRHDTQNVEFTLTNRT